jgi:iron complex transport system substrate-binding protein
MAALPPRLLTCALLVAAASGMVVPVGLHGRVEVLLAAQTATPRRIVSLVPAATEMLFAIGGGGRVAGVGSYDRYPPDVERLPRVGGLLDPNVERILALKPDLVVLYDTQKDLEQQLARAGIPMFRYKHRDLSEVTNAMRALGEAIGTKPAAEAAAARIEQQIAAIKARVAEKPRPRTLIVFGREPGAIRRVDASGGYGFLHDLLDVAGGRDVLADIKRESVQMSTEMILVRAPEVIVELQHGDPVPADRLEIERQAWSKLSSLPAVRNNRVYVLVGDEFVMAGPRIVLAAEHLARTLHPEAFR